MATHTLMLEIPDEVYKDLARQAASVHQTVEDLVLQRATAQQNILPTPQENLAPDLPEDLKREIAALEYLDDKKLGRTASRSHLSIKAAKRLQALHFKRQREGSLTKVEDQEATELVEKYQRLLLIRSHALLLLKERGFDLSEFGIKGE